jgi:tRNA1Val (adenine37-N6)-methyltransferase
VGVSNKQEYSRDSLFDGRLVCVQHRQGYRFSLDAVLLANFVKIRKGMRVLDLGGGCGIISLILAFRNPQVRITVLELQTGLVELIHENIRLNQEKIGNFKDRIEVITGDFRHINEYLPAGTFDWVLCNPPYRRIGSGRVNQGDEAAVARHEIKADLPTALAACAYSIRTRGRCAIVYPAGRSVSLLHELRGNDLEPKRLRMIYSYPGSDARLLLTEAVKGGREGVIVESPLHIYNERNGAYSSEMAGYYKP